jgi:hypothetical protein
MSERRKAIAKKLPKPQIKVNFDSDVPVYAVSGMFGGVNPSEAHLSFFQEILVPDFDKQRGVFLSKVEQKYVCSLKMSPMVFKRFAVWFSHHVREYEEKYGKIDLKALVSKAKETEIDYRFV